MTLSLVFSLFLKTISSPTWRGNPRPSAGGQQLTILPLLNQMTYLHSTSTYSCVLFLYSFYQRKSLVYWLGVCMFVLKRS